MSYRVNLSLEFSYGETGREAVHFTRKNIDINLPESLIPARGDRVEFKHEGDWWVAKVDEKTTTVICASGKADYIITLILGTCYKQTKPSF